MTDNLDRIAAEDLHAGRVEGPDDRVAPLGRFTWSVNVSGPSPSCRREQEEVSSNRGGAHASSRTPSRARGNGRDGGARGARSGHCESAPHYPEWAGPADRADRNLIELPDELGGRRDRFSARGVHRGRVVQNDLHGPILDPELAVVGLVDSFLAGLQGMPRSRLKVAGS